MTTKFFWDLGIGSIEEFLVFVTTTSCVPMSLALSRQVLQTRHLMQEGADNAMKRIQAAMVSLDYLHEMLKDMKKHESDMNSNKDYTFKKVCQVPKQVPLTSADVA